ncbi:MAG: phosphotransferase [Sphingomonadaceae bacterium]
MSVMHLPASVYDIDLEWISSAIRAGGHDVEVIEASRLDVVHATCTKARYALKYGRDAGLPERMILKGAFEDHSQRLKDMYQSEARFYGQLAPLVPLNCPATYWSGIDPHGWRAAILMEDLTQRDVTFCRAQEPFSYGHIQRRLDQLAALHGQTWNSARFDEGEEWHWIEPRFGEFTQGYNDYYLQPERWQGYIELPRGAAISRHLHDREWMDYALRQLGKLEKQDDFCLIHGDTHPGNLYLDADGSPAFLDPVVSRSAWWIEIPYHVISSLDIADRREWEHALLAHYLEKLEQEGGPRIHYDEAWERYRQGIAYGLFIFLINETTFQTEATNTACTARFGAAAMDHDTISALE